MSRALCPLCARIAIRETFTRDDSIREATYQCADGHLFILKWMADQPIERALAREDGTIGVQLKTAPAGNRGLTATTVKES